MKQPEIYKIKYGLHELEVLDKNRVITEVKWSEKISWCL